MECKQNATHVSRPDLKISSLSLSSGRPCAKDGDFRKLKEPGHHEVRNQDHLEERHTGKPMFLVWNSHAGICTNWDENEQWLH